MINASDYHVPVMLAECIEALRLNPDGTYVDVTFGGGGHSQEILKFLNRGTLVAFDQDQDAVENTKKLEKSSDSSFLFIDSNFRYLKKYLRLKGISKVDGILADLGVSSYQIDEPSRGFSIRSNGDLDMRMDNSLKISAKEVINNYEEKDLIHILSAYGEIKNARTLASAFIKSRADHGIENVEELREISLNHAPRGRENKYLAQVFQAFRIEVNDELGVLKEMLIQSGELLNEGGRLVVMSYHSLEDRLVKNFINKGNFKGIDEKDFYGNPIRVFDPENRKPIMASQKEIDRNSRARSAKLRVGIKR